MDRRIQGRSGESIKREGKLIMHKATYMEGTLHLIIRPDGPILIKAGESGGADPTLPDMEFVRSRQQGALQVYLPGPSLKGVVRAQCERICRTLDAPGRNPSDDNPPLADNPMGDGKSYKDEADMAYSSGKYLESLRETIKGDPQRTAIIYRRSAFTAQIFGSTSLAGRVRFADAYPSGEVSIEERNGVAIDRIYGSVAVGPFNYETVVSGDFVTSIAFRNLTLAQLGLLGLALRDLAAGRVAIGFGKSRGLGRVKLEMTALELRYPACELVGNTLKVIGKDVAVPDRTLAGLGAFCKDEGYLLPAQDSAKLPGGLAYAEDTVRGMGVLLEANGDAQVREIFTACMPAWKAQVSR